MARIISIQLEEQTVGTGVRIQLGNNEVLKEIPQGHGAIRFSLILDDKNELTDAEIVTNKIQ